MSTKRNLTRALLILLIVGILVGGGYALYRIGYAQGVRDSVQFEFRGRFDPGFPRGFEHGFRSWGRFGFWPLRAIPGLLFTLGLLALIVVAVTSLLKITQLQQANVGRPAFASTPPSMASREDDTPTGE